MRIDKLDPAPAVKRFAVRNAGGSFILGNPSLSGRKHADGNLVYTSDENEAVRMVLAGYSIRVESKRSPGLVRTNLYIDGSKVS